MLKKIVNRLIQTRWAIGFVRGGMEAVMKGTSPIEDCKLEIEDLQVDWVKMPKDRWFADPFILDVTDKEILLLVEDYPYATRKGIISLLHIDRNTLDINARKELLELPTHLSFPAIWRKDGHIYVYPESAHSGRLDMYEYHSESEELTFVQTICDDVVWDSYITEAFGEPLLFTQAHENTRLDIYQWKVKRFVPYVKVISDKPNARLAGAVFVYKNDIFYPAQNCEKAYGGAIDIKRIKVESGKWRVERVRHLESLHPKYQLGSHTLNEYKGVVVVDVRGYRYGWIGAITDKIVKWLKRKI